MSKNKCYRVVRDDYSGFEVQVKVKFLWWSWWKQSTFTEGLHVNTFTTLDEAKDWINKGCPIEPKPTHPSNVVWVSEHCK